MKTHSPTAETGTTDIPPVPFSHDCGFTATVDTIDTKRVHVRLTGRTEKSLDDLESLRGEAQLHAGNVEGRYITYADQYESDSQNSYYWTFPAVGEESHFTVSDGAGNPFRINFVKQSGARYYEIECEFFFIFGEQYDYNPRANNIFIEYLMKDSDGIYRDTFATPETDN